MNYNKIDMKMNMKLICRLVELFGSFVDDGVYIIGETGLRCLSFDRYFLLIWATTNQGKS